MNLKTFGIAAVVLILSIVAWRWLRPTQSAGETAELSVTVRQGEFKVKVTATGELQAKRSEKIRGPQGMRTVGIWQTNITDMVPEGTLVSEGNYVASLDKTYHQNARRPNRN